MARPVTQLLATIIPPQGELLPIRRRPPTSRTLIISIMNIVLSSGARVSHRALQSLPSPW